MRLDSSQRRHSSSAAELNGTDETSFHKFILKVTHFLVQNQLKSGNCNLKINKHQHGN